MKSQFTIFYSWQSDIKENRNTINDCIKKAIKGIDTNSKKNLKLEINIDRDTKNKSGSPDISDTILKKILSSDIFICDITLVNNNLLNSKIFKSRLTPNPNVLIELGFAINHLGWERIICINNTNYGMDELLPFDIRGHRILSFNSNRNEFKSTLIKSLELSITAIIKNYPEIEEKYNISKISTHDKNIYLEIHKFYSEDLIHDSISCAINSLFSNEYYYDIWDTSIEFYKKTSNQFLNVEIDGYYKKLLDSLDEFRMLCYQNFEPKSHEETSLYDYEETGIEITKELKLELLQKERYFAHKEPYDNETLSESLNRIKTLQNELLIAGEHVKKNYKEFIINYKKNQFKG